MKQYLRLLSYLYPIAFPFARRICLRPARRRVICCLCLVGASRVRRPLHQQGQSLLLVLPVAILAVAVLKGVCSTMGRTIDELRRQSGGGDIRNSSPNWCGCRSSFTIPNTSGRLVAGHQRCESDGQRRRRCVERSVPAGADIPGDDRGDHLYQNWKLAMVSMIVVPLSVVTMAGWEKVAGLRHARAGAHGRHGLDAQ